MGGWKMGASRFGLVVRKRSQSPSPLLVFSVLKNIYGIALLTLSVSMPVNKKK
jgi:hypothetical protein